MLSMNSFPYLQLSDQQQRVVSKCVGCTLLCLIKRLLSVSSYQIFCRLLGKKAAKVYQQSLNSGFIRKIMLQDIGHMVSSLEMTIHCNTFSAAQRLYAFKINVLNFCIILYNFLCLQCLIQRLLVICHSTHRLLFEWEAYFCSVQVFALCCSYSVLFSSKDIWSSLFLKRVVWTTEQSSFLSMNVL